MKRALLLMMVCIWCFPTFLTAQENEHPSISLGFTELIRTDKWVDDYSVDLRIFKNLENGFAIGGKVGSDFVDEFDAALALRKTIKSSLFGYGDVGYSFEDSEGVFTEVGIGTYFLKERTLGITLGYKHYFGPERGSLAIGFIINFL